MLRKILFIFGCVILVSSQEVLAQKTLKKAELQKEAGEYQKAIASYKSYLAEFPDDYAVVSKLAEVLVLSGDLVAADAFYSNIPESM